ncbi:ferritin-like domain-containing protein [Hymenobacter oligotrophus]|nr:ferritin-like domain-containing protein [Hymenobacter oligotrophus]
MMTFADWTAYFRANQNHLAELSWDDTYRLTERERRAAGRSLQHFQRGESSEGHHLYHHAQTSHDADYLAAMRLFIAEEQGHAKVLGRFLDVQGLPRLRVCFTDNVFRWLRRLSNWEHTIRLLLTAEIIAAVYYRALYHATYSGLLQQICLRILRDERQHIAFQCSTLRYLRPRRSSLGWWLSQQLHRGLMIGTTAVVWVCYNRTLWAGGMGPVGFAAGVAQEWERAQQLLRTPAAELPAAQGSVGHLGPAHLATQGQ